MIVLVQMRDADTDRWDDLRVPRRVGPPVKGERLPVETVDEFAKQLIDNKLVGEYRVFYDNGTMWRVTIIRQDQYIAETRQEIPV